MMLRLVRKYGNCDGEFSSQLTSTMHYLIDFPDWPVIFVEPSLSVTTTDKGISSVADISFQMLQQDYLNKLLDKKSAMKICFVSASSGAGKSTLLREIAAYLKKEGQEVYVVDLYRQRVICQGMPSLNIQDLLRNAGDFCYDEQKSVILFDRVDVIVDEFPNQMDNLFSQMRAYGASIVIATTPSTEGLLMQKFKMFSTMLFSIKPFQREQQLSLLMQASGRSAEDCKFCLNKLDAYSDLLKSAEFIMFTSNFVDTTAPSKVIELFHSKKVEISATLKGGLDPHGHQFKSFTDGYKSKLQNIALQHFELTTDKITLDPLQKKVLDATGIVFVEHDGKAKFQYNVNAEFLAAQGFLRDIAYGDCKKYIQERKSKKIMMFVDEILADYNAEQKEKIKNDFAKYQRVDLIFKCAIKAGLENIFNLLRTLFTFRRDQPDKIYLSDGFLYLELAHKKSLSMTDSLFEMDAHLFCKSPKVPVKKEKEQFTVAEHVHELSTINDSITCVRNKNKSVLLYAAERNKRNFIKYFISKGINTQETDAMNWTCVHVAVEKADLNTIELLLSCDESLIKRDTKTGLNCFHVAAHYANVKTCELLIKKGVDWKSKDKLGNDALHFAAMAGNDAVLEHLVKELEFNVNGTSNAGITALHFAASRGHHGVIQTLIALGADRMAMTSRGWNALHFAVRYAGLETVKILTQDLTRVEMDSLFTRTTDGCSLPHLSACNDGMEILNFLLTRRVDFLEEDVKGWNLLHFACKYNNEAIVEWLINSQNNNAFLNKPTRNSLTGLILAARFNYLNICKLLVEKGANVYHSDKSGKNAISYAFAAKRYDIVDFLASKATFYDIFISAPSRQQMRLAIFILRDGSRVDEVNEKSDTALFHALKCNKYNVTKMLLKNGANVNHKNADGLTPLMNAAEYAHYCIFDLLIEYGASFHCQNKKGENVLHITSKTGNLAAAQRLLESNEHPDVNSVDAKGNTALHLAAYNNREQIAQLLLAMGADVNARDDILMTPYLVAAAKSVAVYEILVKQKIVNLVAVNSQGKNALHLASNCGNEKVLRHLLNQNNLSIFARDKCCGHTPLHHAAAKGWVDIAKLLIASGADVNATDFNKSTPLTIAAQLSSKKMCEYLVLSGATLDAKDATGDNALHCAATGGKYENVLYLIEKPSFTTKQRGRDECTVLHFSIMANNLSIMKLLIDLKGTDIEAEDEHKNTPLLLAAKCTNVEAFEYLQGKNAKLSAKNKHGDTALHCAVLGGKLDIVKYLIETQKFSVESKNSNERRPLHHAALVGDLEIAKYLLSDKGYMVNINARDKDNLTPFLIARTVEMMQFLVQKGAILEVWDKDGNYALHRASRSGNIDVVKYLIGFRSDLLNKVNLNGISALHCASINDAVQVA
jgi:ankyrin repeat protein